jgi:hypothetical protein
LDAGAPFQSFFGAGFECSTIRRRSGRLLDLVAATRHDQFAALDYARLRRQGLRVAREGVRWHLVESRPGAYDFSSVEPIVRAARETETQVIWDLCHFGWPDHLDLFGPDFAPSLARYGSAFVRWLQNEMGGPAFIVPVNEISFFSWASGDEGSLFPFALGRGSELKAQLVRAAVQSIDAIRSIRPDTRFVHVDPIIHVVAHPRHPEDQLKAEAYRLSQFEAFDMLAGRLRPELGGSPEHLDILGVNFYPQNQWFYDLDGVRRVRHLPPLTRRNRLYRPFREMLAEVYDRYRRPVFIAETGAEDRLRPGWLRYVCQETSAALSTGVPVQGICLYPILNHPGWVDDRHCCNGLWDYPDDHGNREIHAPLAAELRRWQRVFSGRATGDKESSDETECLEAELTR